MFIKFDLIFREHYQLFFLINYMDNGNLPCNELFVCFFPKNTHCTQLKTFTSVRKTVCFNKRLCFSFPISEFIFSYSEEKLHSLEQDTLLLPFFQMYIVKMKLGKQLLWMKVIQMRLTQRHPSHLTNPMMLSQLLVSQNTSSVKIHPIQ